MLFALPVQMNCVTVGRYGVGLDNIGVKTATSLGIVVTNVPAYCIDDVADHTMALLLACTRKVSWFDRDVKAGRYDLAAQSPLGRLRGHTLGLASMGKIGRAVAERASPSGLRVIGLQPRGTSPRLQRRQVKFVTFSELLEQSNYLSLHLPATEETVEMLNRSAFGRMKRGVVIINTARGSLIRSADLVEALNSGKVASAGIDVWPREPIPTGDTLALHPRVIATPHSAFYSDAGLLNCSILRRRRWRRYFPGTSRKTSSIRR